MSLTSRISNLFSTNHSPHLAPANGYNHPDRGRGASVDYGEISEERVNSSRRHVLEEEEESRPPYLHVRSFS